MTLKSWIETYGEQVIPVKLLYQPMKIAQYALDCISGHPPKDYFLTLAVTL